MMPPSDLNSMTGGPPVPEEVRGSLQPRPLPLHPVAAPPAPPVLTAAPNALLLLKALRRRLVLALTVGLLLAAAAATATWFLMPPPKFTARTQLYVATTPPNILFPEQDHVKHEVFIRSQAYLIKDRFVLDAALKMRQHVALNLPEDNGRNSPKVEELSLVKEQTDPLQWLEKEIKVEFPGPEFIHITLSGDRRDELGILVSAITKSYLDGVVNKDRLEHRAKLEKLKSVLKSFEDRTRTKRSQLRQLQDQNGAQNEQGMAIAQQIALDHLQGVKKDLTLVRHELRQLQIELGLHPDWVETVWPRYAAALNCLPGLQLPVNHAVVALLHEETLVTLATVGPRASIAARQVDELIDKDKFVSDRMEWIQNLQILLEHMRENAHPEAFEKASAKYRKQLDTWNKELEARRLQLRPLLFDKFREQLRVQAQENRRRMQEKYTSLKEMEKTLLQEASQLAEETRQIRKHAVDFGQLKEEIEKEEKVMRGAADKINSMEIEQEAPARITQPNKEAILETPDEMKRKLMATGGAAAGALALVLLAFSWFEFQSRKVHSPQEVVEGLGLRLMGTVPDHSRRGWLTWLRRSDVNSAYSQSLLTESVDSARTMLLHTARLEKLQIVMITSALAGEGKTSLASHLAASLARAGRRTLLVDSDLRNPTLHRLFDHSRAPGLSELLRAEVDLASIIRDTQIPNLWLISAGLADLVALQTLALDALPQIFQQLRAQYDFIVVDSCPVLPVADALLVGQHVDAVIFSLLREVSRLPRVYQAYQRLAVLDVRMLGAVVNGTQDDDTYTDNYRYVSPGIE